MKWFRQCDRRYPFLWETTDQPAARWHGDREGPAQYFARTPEGAWAEFLRHEEISDPADLAGISRALWVIDDDDESVTATSTALPSSTAVGGLGTYPECQEVARQLRARGATSLLAPSAALVGGMSMGYRVDRGFRGQHLDAQVLVIFGRRPRLIGLLAVEEGRPPADVLRRVRPLST